MRRTIGRVLHNAVRNQYSVIIRPHSATALLVQLDNFTAERAAQGAPLAFMTICTFPDSYQVWLAVSDGPQESEKDAAKRFRTHIRRGSGADHSTTGAVRIAGSPNVKPEHAPEFTFVELTGVNAGRTVTVAELEKAGYWSLKKNQHNSPRPVFLLHRPRGQMRE
jgi:RepB DNA-primase from phage plasmid